jgi:hypothetical protein
MKDRKRNKPESDRRAGTLDHDPDPLPDIDGDDDESGEMASAGQDLGVTVDDERDASSVEDVGVDDEDDDWLDLDRDDGGHRGRGTSGGQFD